MDKCGICMKPADQLFETGKDGVYACFKCQPLVPEVTIGDNAETSDQSITSVKEESDDHYVDANLHCTICNKLFEKSMQLQNHMRNHRAERRFVCTYCNKAFSQSNNLRAHLRIHTNERPYKCQECGKAFTQVTNLNNHVRLHTGERPFACPEPGCDKAYAQVTNLNQHRKRHLSGRADRSYDCALCGERFSQRNHMFQHKREAHGMKSPARPAAQAAHATHAAHACDLCGETFAGDKQLRIHVRQHTLTNTAKWGVSCVFSSCGARLAGPREHTEHLLRAHQLRVLAGAGQPQRSRGRPPKISQSEDPLDISEHIHEVPITYEEVKIIKEEPQFMPKLKVQSLFQ